MAHPHHAIARAYFEALSAGSVPDELLTDDFRAWTTSSGAWNEKARFQGGIRLLASVFDGGFHYTVDSLTAEDDRVAAEVHAEGRLVNGEDFANTYVFVLRIRDGKVASVAEHFNPDPVRTQLGPLLQAAMAKMAG